MLGEKGTEVVNALGKHRADFSEEDLAKYGEYCKNDTEITYALYQILKQFSTPKEQYIIDLMLRMFIDPVLKLDREKLEEHLVNVQTKKEKLMAMIDASIGREELMSNDKFAAVLRKLGVEPPVKVSLRTNKLAYAFSKTDQEFKELLEHEDPRVQAVVSARLGVKSTLEETRTESFIGISQRGPLPIMLNYYGAHTGRASGGDKMNLQNLPRGGTLRKSIRAPKGHMVVAVDSAQIEARVVAWLAGESALVEDFRNGVDIYSKFATDVYKREVTKANKVERFVGKTCILGLGYGMGKDKFKQTLKIGQGGISLDIEIEEAERIVNLYRDRFPSIVDLWSVAGRSLDKMSNGYEYEFGTGVPLKCTSEGIHLPNGMLVRYPNLAKADNGYTYDTRKGKVKIYGGKIVENCIAEDTEVLTDRGWVPIQQVTKSDKVHDGVEFVYHGGVVFKSIQPCVKIDGVFMTDDHEVLTDEGWKAASQNPKPYRPDLRHVDGVEPRTQQREEEKLAVPMQVRKALCQSGSRRAEGVQTWRDTELRVRHKAVNRGEESHSRNEQASCIQCVEKHDRSVSSTVASSVAQLWSKRDNSVRALGKFREFLGRYGRHLRTWIGFGSDRQQWGIFPRELPLGYAAAELSEQTELRAESRCEGVISKAGDIEIHSLLSTEARVGSIPTIDSTKPSKQVYDILNAGPRSRFVVRGDSGPFIVHNCVQALARIVVFDQMAKIDQELRRRDRLEERRKVVLTVHDEIVAVVPEAEAKDTLDYMVQVMSTPPKWAAGLPVACEGDFALTYGDCK
jgi:DNA polymerase